MASPSEVYINVGESGDLSIDVGENQAAVPLSQGPVVDVPVPVLRWKRRRPMKCPLPRHPNRSNRSTRPAIFRASGPTLDEAVEYELNYGHTLKPDIDERILRRTISNRLAAKRSRLKRVQVVIDFHKQDRDLQVMIANLKSKMEAIERKHKILLAENVALKAALLIRTNAVMMAQAKTEEYMRQLTILRELYSHMYLGQSPNSIPPTIDEKEMMNVPAAAAAASEEPNLDNLMGMIDLDDDDAYDEGVDQYLNLDIDDDEMNVNFDFDPNN